jgi:hypothetical protein
MSYNLFSVEGFSSRESCSCRAGIFLRYQNEFYYLMSTDPFSIREKVAEGRRRGRY